MVSDRLAPLVPSSAPRLLAVAMLAGVLPADASGAARFYTPDYGVLRRRGDRRLRSRRGWIADPDSQALRFPAEEAGLGGLWKLAFTPDGTRAISGFFFTGGVQAYRVPPSGVFELGRGDADGLRDFGGDQPRRSLRLRADSRLRHGVARRRHPPLRDRGGRLADATHAGRGKRRVRRCRDHSRRTLPLRRGGEPNRALRDRGGRVPRTPLARPPRPGPDCWRWRADGRFLFAKVSGGSSSGVTSFAIGADGGLQQAGEPALIADSFTRLFAVAPDGRHLYLADSNSNAIHAVAIADDGTPSVVGSMPIDDPESVGVSPDGRFLVYYRGGGSDERARRRLDRSGRSPGARWVARRLGIPASRSRSSSSPTRRRSRASAPSPAAAGAAVALRRQRARCAPLATTGTSATGRSSPTAAGAEPRLREGRRLPGHARP